MVCTYGSYFSFCFQITLPDIAFLLYTLQFILIFNKSHFVTKFLLTVSNRTHQTVLPVVET
jgi:hypothetical protein